MAPYNKRTRVTLQHVVEDMQKVIEFVGSMQFYLASILNKVEKWNK